jgi:hypothetical protein
MWWQSSGGSSGLRVRGGGRAVVTTGARRWAVGARLQSSGTSGTGQWPRSRVARIVTSTPRSLHRWRLRLTPLCPDLAAVVVKFTSGWWLRRHPEQWRGGMGLAASVLGRQLKDPEHRCRGAQDSGMRSSHSGGADRGHAAVARP